MKSPQRLQQFMLQRTRPAIRSTLVVIGLALSWSCSNDETKTNSSSSHSDRGLPILGKVPHFAFIDQSSNPYGLNDLKHRVWLANFIFTRCPSTCPLQTAKLAKFQESLQQKPSWSAVRVLSFSVEPEYDTPEILEQYATAHGATGNWHFLTGERKEIWEFCEQGLKLPVDESGLDSEMPILHSPRIVLIDGIGQIRGYYDGLDDDSLAQLESDLELAMEATAR